MKSKTIGLFVFLLTALLVNQILFGQSSTSEKPCSFGEKIEKDKPSVFLSYEGVGKRKPLKEGESNEGIWLRLHNNTRGEIYFCAFGISKDGEMLMFFEKGSELGIYYEVERVNFAGQLGGGTPENIKKENREKKDESISLNVPVGYKVGDVCHRYTLPSGKSVSFSVPREHLARNLSIKIRFSYQWEGEDSLLSNEPEHYVRFYSSSLPENIVQP